jgi:hypothetical protein
MAEQKTYRLMVRLTVTDSRFGLTEEYLDTAVAGPVQPDTTELRADMAADMLASDAGTGKCGISCDEQMTMCGDDP